MSMNATCYRVTARKNGAYTILPVHLPAYAYYACVKPDSCSLDTAGEVPIRWIVDA